MSFENKLYLKIKIVVQIESQCIFDKKNEELNIHNFAQSLARKRHNNALQIFQ